MRFEISYRTGTSHEVEHAGRIAVIGRDPGCDIVLNDTKCSRRHAVVEEDPEGLLVRDSGSSNGVYVNGKRIERKRLQAGDTIRLGDVRLRVLPEVGETVVVAPEDLEPFTVSGAGGTEGPDLPPREAARPERDAAPAARASRPPAGVMEGGRPLTVTVLSTLWALSVPASIAGVVVAARRAEAGLAGWALAAAAGVALAGVGITMTLGLRALASWARHLQIAAAVLGLLACPFTLASATVLLYMSRPDVKVAFDGTRAPGAAGDTAEPTFALSLLGMLALGLALTAIAALLRG
jgi:hypothetical protein